MQVCIERVVVPAGAPNGSCRCNMHDVDPQLGHVLVRVIAHLYRRLGVATKSRWSAEVTLSTCDWQTGINLLPGTMITHAMTFVGGTAYLLQAGGLYHQGFSGFGFGSKYRASGVSEVTMF